MHKSQNKIDAKDSLPTITLKEVQLIGIKQQMIPLLPLQMSQKRRYP